MTEYVDVDANRARSGRQRRVPAYSNTHSHDLRADDSLDLPDFGTFLEWLKSSQLSPVPVRTFSGVLERPGEVAVIQERVSSLSPEDEGVLRELSSLDDLPSTWEGGVRLTNSSELPSQVIAGVKPPGSVLVSDGLEQNEVVTERLGDAILVERTSFRAFHVDVGEVGHSF